MELALTCQDEVKALILIQIFSAISASNFYGLCSMFPSQLNKAVSQYEE